MKAHFDNCMINFTARIHIWTFGSSKQMLGEVLNETTSTKYRPRMPRSSSFLRPTNLGRIPSSPSATSRTQSSDGLNSPSGLLGTSLQRPAQHSHPLAGHSDVLLENGRAKSPEAGSEKEPLQIVVAVKDTSLVSSRSQSAHRLNFRLLQNLVKRSRPFFYINMFLNVMCRKNI